MGLFLGLGIISLILAYISLTNYQYQPADAQESYGLFLVQKSHLVDERAIGELYLKLQPKKLMVSFERLFKGGKRALVVYGPLSVFRDFQDRWGLVEIEDYSLTAHLDHITLWEMKARTLPKRVWAVSSLVSEGALLSVEEQFWWQVILKPEDRKEAFLSSLRGVVVSGSLSLSRERGDQLIEALKEVGLVKLPTRYVQRGLLTFYQKRVLSAKRREKMIFTPRQLPDLF